MQALISPNEAPITYVASWTTNFPYQPVMAVYANSCRVAQVEPDDKIFVVAESLSWVDCADNIVADQWYFDPNDSQIKEVPLKPQPE